MVFSEHVMTAWAQKLQWKDLKCTKCGHKFKVGEKVYARHKGGRNGTVSGHLCQSCYDAKFVDV